jgi:hypothetical protein
MLFSFDELPANFQENYEASAKPAEPNSVMFKNEILDWPIKTLGDEINCPKYGKNFDRHTYFNYLTVLLFEETRANILEMSSTNEEKYAVELQDIFGSSKQKYNMVLVIKSSVQEGWFEIDTLYILTCEFDGKMIASGFAFLHDSERSDGDDRENNTGSEMPQKLQKVSSTIKFEVRNQKYVSVDQAKAHFHSNFAKLNRRNENRDLSLTRLGNWSIQKCGSMGNFIRMHTILCEQIDYPLLNKLCGIVEETPAFKFTEDNIVPYNFTGEYYYQTLVQGCNSVVKEFIGKFNQYQCDAIANCTEHFGQFSGSSATLNSSSSATLNKISPATLNIVKGPPGCGKTKLVVGLIHILRAANKTILVNTASNKALTVVLIETLKLFEECHMDTNYPKIALVGKEDTLSSLIGENAILVGFHESSYVPFNLLCTNIAKRIILSLKKIDSNVDKLGSAHNSTFGESVQNITKIFTGLIAALKCRLRGLYILMHSDLEKLGALLKKLCPNSNNLHVEVKKIIRTMINNHCPENSNLARNYYDKIRPIQTEWVSSANLVFCTLNYSVLYSMKKSNLSIDVMIVDEAAQAFELEILSPLTSFVINHMILVGDPKQLPPTLKSKILIQNRMGLLMERLIDMGQVCYIQLNEQYRMHPRIASASNRLFYGGLIENCSGLESRQCELYDAERDNQLDGVDFLLKRCFGINVDGTELVPKRGDGVAKSYVNPQEAMMVTIIVNFLTHKLNVNDPKKICVVTFYSEQVKLIRACLNFCGLTCSVRTVDSFQGSEVDYMILSYVRTKNLGFLNDERRLNVAWTRAKHLLINIGCFKAIKKTGMTELVGYWNGLHDLGCVVDQLDAHKKFSEVDYLINLYNFNLEALLSVQDIPLKSCDVKNYDKFVHDNYEIQNSRVNNHEKSCQNVNVVDRTLVAPRSSEYRHNVTPNNGGVGAYQ